MTTKNGLSIDDWIIAKYEMRQVLIETARNQGIIPYSELVEKLQTVHLEPDSFALAHLLGEISSEENAAGRGMLSVLVVYKDGDKQPGQGFFQLAKRAWARYE